MANVVLTMTGLCAGGDHATIGVTVAGQDAGSYNYTVADIRTALTADERETIIRGLLKIYAIGRTLNQMKTGLQSGATVVF